MPCRYSSNPTKLKASSHSGPARADDERLAADRTRIRFVLDHLSWSTPDAGKIFIVNLCLVAALVAAPAVALVAALLYFIRTTKRSPPATIAITLADIVPVYLQHHLNIYDPTPGFVPRVHSRMTTCSPRSFLHITLHLTSLMV